MSDRWDDLFGDELMEYLDEQIKLDKKEAKELQGHLESGVRTFKHKEYERVAIVHPSSKKPNTYQFTYFDKFGPIGDFEAKTNEILATKIQENNFEPCSELEFKEISNPLFHQEKTITKNPKKLNQSLER